MGYLKITDSNGKVHPIDADNLRIVKDGQDNKDIDLVYGASANITIGVTSSGDRDTVKEAVRAALVEYQGNQEGPAIEANGGKSVASVSQSE